MKHRYTFHQDGKVIFTIDLDQELTKPFVLAEIDQQIMIGQLDMDTSSHLDDCQMLHEVIA